MTRILVAGAGIGGLTAALALHEAGFDVHVYERASELTEAGAGIQLSPNAMRVFAALHLMPALRDVAFVPEGVEFRLHKSGFTVMRMPLGKKAEQRYGLPYLHVHRADLLEILVDAVNTRLGHVIETGRQVTSLEQDAKSATLIFSDGSREQGEAIVGADGIRSTIRECLFGPDDPQFSGHVAWRGVVPADRLRHVDIRPVATSWMSPHGHAVTYFLRRGELVNFVGVQTHQTWKTESWTEKGDRGALRAAFQDWHPTVQAIVDAIDEPYRWALFVRRPMRRWSEGRVTLLGDACHAMLPYMAQGAAMAVEDAYALGKCLQFDAVVADAFNRYQNFRRGRTTRVQHAARANGTMFHLAGVSKLLGHGALSLSSLVSPSGLLRRNDWVFGYDATNLI